MANIVRSIVGRRLGLDRYDNLVSDGRIILPGASYPMSSVVLADDFLGDVLQDPWGVQTGSDGSAAAFAVSAANGGMARGTMGAGAGASMAANGVQLHSALNWYAGNGGLMMEARVKVAAISTVAIFVGFTDQVGALEMPIHSAGSANTITTNATDACGLFFDTSMTDDYWWAAGVKNGTDATHASSGIAPTAATYQRLRVDVDANGNARMSIDGKVVASVANAVTTTVALTPVVAGFRRAASSTTLDVDSIYVQMDRA